MAKKKKAVTGKKSKVSQIKRNNFKSNKRGGVNQLGATNTGKVKKKTGQGKQVAVKHGSGKTGKWTSARYAHEAAKKAGVSRSKKPQHDEQQDENAEKEEEDTIMSDEEEDEDVAEDFEDEDLAYIKQLGAGKSFLSGVEESEPQEQPKSRKNKHKENEPASFERDARQIMADPRRKMKALLPIKGSQGFEYRWEEKRKADDVGGDGDGGGGDGGDDDGDEAAEVKEGEVPQAALPTLTLEELLEHRREKLTKKKQRIATLASAIQENPEKNVFKLRELVAMLRETDPDLKVTLPKLAMVSLCELFKDVAPGYRIREIGDADPDVQHKKEVKARRHYESFLLKQYRNYLEYLESAINEIRRTKKQEKKEQRKKVGNPTTGVEIPMETRTAMAEIATRCLCSLLNNLFHFNYCTNIITIVVTLMVNKNELISDMCCVSIRQLFRDDIYGEGAADAVRFITRLLKAKRYNVELKVLDTFLALKIKETNLNNPDIAKRRELEEKKNKMRRLSRSQRRFKKRMDNLDKELQATEASENKKRKLRLHTEIIQAVFATYFRILKQASGSQLLPSVLEGLAKFAHLINIEFFDDLVKALHHLIDSGTLGHRESLHCVLTAFQIISGQGDVLNIDPTRFFTHFYVTLLEVNAGISSPDTSVVIECLDAMISKRHKQVQIQRIMAYLKRLCTLSLQCLPNGTLGYMGFIKDGMQRHPKSDALLDTDSGGSGVYMPELHQPEHCHAHNTVLWELHLLKRHYHRVVRDYANYVSRGFPINGSGSVDIELIRKTPQHFLEEYDPTEMEFRPELPPKSIQISKTKAKLQFQSISDKKLVQKEFQKTVTMEKQTMEETDNWTGIDFAEQFAKKIISTKENPKSAKSKTGGKATQVVQNGAIKRKAASFVSRPKTKKFKGQTKGIIRQANTGIIRANGK